VDKLSLNLITSAVTGYLLLEKFDKIGGRDISTLEYAIHYPSIDLRRLRISEAKRFFDTGRLIGIRILLRVVLTVNGPISGIMLAVYHWFRYI